MGGNIFSEARRINKKELYGLIPFVMPKLKSIFPGRVNRILSYREKPIYGDIDILIEKTYIDDKTRPLIKKFNIQNLVKNGPVWSFLVQDVQIDLIFVSTDVYSFAFNYFSWNDLGNLIGRIAHKFKLKYGHDGLFYPLRENTHLIDTILITRNTKIALEILGYNPNTFSRGFNTLENIFEYTVSSPYFNRNIYLLPNRSHRARTRDKKRKTYIAFLEWLKTQPGLHHFEYTDPVIAFMRFTLLATYPDFNTRYQNAIKERDIQRTVKEKFNGRMVKNLTNLTDKTLGIAIVQLKQKFESKEAFQQFVLDSNPQQIKEFILDNIPK